MRRTILGKKLGMSQIFDRSGDAVPITLIQAGPCIVLQIKTRGNDGYDAIQLGFDEKKPKRTNKPQKGRFEKAGTTPKRFIREVRVDNPEAFSPGQAITAGVIRTGDLVDVTGTSKGKGFAGVMKRHGFKGHPASHGTHESYRGPGSIGAAADPARVFKGKKMPGQMGDETVTIQNLKVIDVREDQNLIAIKGPVPGGKNGFLVIRDSIKKPSEGPYPQEPEVPEAEAEQVEEALEEPVESEVQAETEVPDVSVEQDESEAQSEPEEQPESEEQAVPETETDDTQDAEDDKAGNQVSKEDEPAEPDKS